MTVRLSSILDRRKSKNENLQKTKGILSTSLKKDESESRSCGRLKKKFIRCTHPQRIRAHLVRSVRPSLAAFFLAAKLYSIIFICTKVKRPVSR